MPKNYVLRRSPFDKNRMLKIGKSILEDAREDREFALDSHRYFKEMVEQSENTDNDAKRLMIECLKLAQSSKNNSVKVLALMVKLEELGGNTSNPDEASVISFNDLEKLADAKR